ncbi:TetR/AcrR family transcriptional regulator [bacterium]|nr:TetR/AcrR family transcriptional regulator [bacterium]
MPRKNPTQARSRARVERILEAAAQVVQEKGYDGATTNAIARRARTSIGSLYQFFPNKAALMHALALRYTDELRGLLGRALVPGVTALPWPQLVERIIDAFAEFHHTRAGFRAVWYGGHVSAELLACAFEAGRDIAASAEPLLVRLAPSLPAKDRALVARVATETVGALLILSVQAESQAHADRVIDEAKKVVVSYLARYAEIPASATKP